MSLSCAYCAASFATKDRRDRHVLTHSKIKPFSCTVCQVGFNRKDHLQRHYSLLHKDLPPSDEPGQSPPWKHRTQTACSHCAHAKTKCDKQHPCSRCIKKGLDCRRRKSQNEPKLADASVAISPWNDGNIAAMTDDTSLFDIGGMLSPLDQSFTFNDLSADFSFLAPAGSFASDPEKDIGSIDRSIAFPPMDKDLSRDLTMFNETFASGQDLSTATNIERPHTESEAFADSVWPHIASDSSSMNADSASSTQASSPRSRNISALTDLTQASGFDTLDVACIMYKDDSQHNSIVSARSILSPVMLTMVMRDRLVEFLRRVSEQEVFPISSHSKQVTRQFLPSLKVLNYHLCHHLAKTHTTSFVQASLIQAFTYSSEEDARRLAYVQVLLMIATGASFDQGAPAKLLTLALHQICHDLLLDASKDISYGGRQIGDGLLKCLALFINLDTWSSNSDEAESLLAAFGLTLAELSSRAIAQIG